VTKARVLFSQAHEEDFPAKFVEKLPEAEILYDISSQPLNSETLNGYTCIALINPKTPLLDEEKGHIVKYKESEGGVFLTFNLLNEKQYERFKPNNDLIKSIFNVDLVTKRVLPEIEFGDFELEYKKMFKPSYKTIEKIKADGEDVARTINYVPKSFLRTSVSEEFEINEDSDFISFFSGAEKSRVILERETSPIPYSFSPYYLCDDTKIHVGNFGEYYFLEDDSLVGPHKQDSHYITKESWKLLKERIESEFQLYENVGIVSDITQLGRAVCLSTHELFDMIENESELAKTCQNLLQDILIWESKETAHKLSIIKDEKAIREFEEERTEAHLKINEMEQKLQEAREQLAVVPTTDIRWKFMYQAANLGLLVYRGRIGEAIIEMKDTGENIERTGNPENFGSSILYYHNEFEKEQVEGQLPSNLPMEECSEIRPRLVSLRKELYTLIERAIAHYKKMEE
jgi:hypothetical protein